MAPRDSDKAETLVGARDAADGAGRAVNAASVDPWVLEAKRSASAPRFRPPALGPVPKARVYLLGLLAALRAAGLVLVAEAIARGIAALAAGDLSAETTRLIVVLGIAGALLRAGAEWATSVVARRIATEVKQRIRGRLWRRIAAGDVAGGGTAVLAADGLDDLDDYYVQSLPATIAAAVVPLLIGLRVLGADWLSAAVIVLTVPLIPFFMVLIGKHTQQRTDEALTALTRLADHLAELARGLPVLVGLGRVDEQATALEQLQRGYRERTQETLRWAFLSALALELVATISVAIVAVFLGLRLLNGTMELEPALVALILAPEAYAALRQVGTAFHASQDGLSALDRSEEILRRAAADDVRASPAVSGADVGNPRLGAVRIDGLTVHYAGRDAATLTGVTAELVGIVSIAGPSGAGKSTLLAALAGALPAHARVAGRVTGIGADAVGWAPQAPRAFAATPREELSLYGTDPMVALGELGLAHVADAAVPELSPGELRRLAVARALARVDAGARLLVLDEPTAHLDGASADRVRAAILRRADRAVVVLASHEPDTTAFATMTVPVGVAVATATEVVSRRARPSAASSSTSGGAASSLTSGGAASSSTSGGGAPSSTSGGGAPSSTSGGGAPSSTNGGAASSSTSKGAVAARIPRLTVRSLIRPHVLNWAGAMAMAVIAVGMGLALTAVSGWLIVRASIEEHIMMLLLAIVGVRAFGIFRSVGRYAERLLTHDAAFKVVDALRLRLWRSIAARGTGSRRLLEGGAPLDYLVTLADELRDLLPRVLPPIAVGVLVIVGTGVTTALVAPALTLTVVLTLTLATAVAAGLAIWSERGAAAARVEARSEIVRGTAALASAALDLRGNGVSDTALSQLDAASARLAAAERRAAWAAGLGSAVVTAAVTALACLVPVLAPLSAEAASVIALLTLALLEPLGDLVAGAHRVPSLRAVLRRLAPVLRPAPQPAWGSGTPASPVGAVELDGVTVRYPGVEAPAVADVSGRASAGRWLVLDGPSGSGKSTLLSAVMGALPVEAGAIRAEATPGAATASATGTAAGVGRSARIDAAPEHIALHLSPEAGGGVPLTEFDERAWRSRVAWCPQDAYVFDSSLRGNLLLSRSRADAPDESAMRDALERAGLGPLLESLADGLDTRVGAAGSALSGGERQRLAVARALLTRADVILLDEPTAHLDAPTAAAMMADVRAATADRVVILVSHRQDDRLPADEVVRLA